MKKTLLLLPAILIFFFANAQTFTSYQVGFIDDPPAVQIFPLTVSGLPTTIDTASFGLIMACWNITHTYDGDLDIILQSPDGNTIFLSNNNGGGGNNFTGTCVAEDATDGEISLGVAPFTGTYYPDDFLNTLNNGQDPNGIWNLIVVDEAPVDTGEITMWSLAFGNNPPPNHIPIDCNTSVAWGCACPDGSVECDLLPDMINSENYIESDWSEHNGYILAGVATPNIGYGPMEIHSTNVCYCDTVWVNCNSTCADGSQPKQLVAQTIYHKNNGAMTIYNVPGGTMTYHPSHGHLHIDDWTYNTLRIRGVGDDPTNWPIIGEGAKISFCLINLGTCTNGNEYCIDDNGSIVDQSTMTNGGLGSVTGCGNDQGIFVGNLDIYNSGLDGQDIQFGNICNGEYYIVSITDPFDVITESNDNNNYAKVLIDLANQQGNCCDANFYADATYGVAPFQVQFVDSTIPIANSWLWSFGDGTTSTDQFPIHIYTQAGTYTVTLITNNNNSCSDARTRTDYITVDFGIGMPFLENGFEMNAFPNPFTLITSIQIHLDVPEYLQLTVVDVTGKTIKQLHDGIHPGGDHTIQFDAGQEGLTNGFYFVKAIAGSKEYFVKMVKVE